MLFWLLAVGYTDTMPGYSTRDIPGKRLEPLRLRNEHSVSEEFIPIDHIFLKFLKKWDIAGASVAIAKEGKLIFAKGYGYTSVNDSVEVQPFNLFRIASVSKLITAAAIMQLEEQAQLSFDDRVFGKQGILNDSIYLHPRDPRALNITVKHLLTHSAGWTTRWGDHMFIPHAVAKFMNVPPPPDTKTIVRFALAKKLHFTPGTYRSYSNLGYSILGLVIEEVTGQSYMEYVMKNIMEPLGIYDMQLGKNLPEDRASLEVTYCEPDGSELVKSIYNEHEMVQRCYGGNDIESLAAAGGWIASAPDLLRFVLSIDGDPGRPDILNQSKIEIMTNPALGFAPVGWKATVSNGSWWRTGSFAGMSAMVKHQNNGFTWVVLLNSSTWKASKFPAEIDKTMRRVFSNVKEWPERDLFEYRIPDPIKPHGLDGI